ncbi:MAG TPA: hypothetical protein VH500_14450 [Nitrososphaeraceae archaeon]
MRSISNEKELLESLHKEGITIFTYEGRKVPCIYVTQKRYEEIIGSAFGKKFAIDTILNIINDSSKPDVFVDIYMNFLNLGLEQYFLVPANDNLEFFEAMANSAIIAIAPEPSSHFNGQNIFMVQLPKIDAIENAISIIKSKLTRQI